MTITATVNGTPITIAPVVIATSGNFVTLDEMALSIPVIQLTTGSSLSIPISFSGYTSLHIDSAALNATGGTLSLFDAGPPAGYNYLIPNVALSGQIDAVNTDPLLSVNDVPFGFVNPDASGQVYVATGVAIALDGITLGSLDVDGDGPLPAIFIKGDFIFNGVPEPGTAILLGLGLAAVAVRRRSA